MEIEEIKNIAKEMVDVRHHLHTNPELSFEEFATSAYIKDILSHHSISCQTVAKTGLVAVIEGQGKGEKRGDILIRADMDALPIIEDWQCEFRSNNGFMHACGHDIHMSVLIGVLIYLSLHPDTFTGRVIGLFEPGEEESPGGASLVIKEHILDQYSIKAALALHTAHDIEVGRFGLREGIYMASTSEMRIFVEGSGGHAALPVGSNPILAAASVIIELNKLEQEMTNEVQPVIIAVGRVVADGSTNIIPSLVSMSGTIRAMSLKGKAAIKSKIDTITRNSSFHTKTKISVEFTDGYPPVRNDLSLTAKARDILADSYGEENVLELGLRMTADDFGFFSELYPSFYYRLGVLKKGSVAHAPHTSKFTADDDSIYFGMDSMIKLVKNIL